MRLCLFLVRVCVGGGGWREGGGVLDVTIYHIRISMYVECYIDVAKVIDTSKCFRVCTGNLMRKLK